MRGWDAVHGDYHGLETKSGGTQWSKVGRAVYSRAPACPARLFQKIQEQVPGFRGGI